MPNTVSVASPRCLNGNFLKLIAAISMLIDHIGVVFFPFSPIYRIIGRLAFPIFAFMIAEGCHYTKNRLRYFLGIFLLGAVCQTVYFAVSGDTHMNILLNFSCSVAIIYLLQEWKKRHKYIFLILFAAAVVTAYVCYSFLSVDYGFWGMMTPVFLVFAYPAKGERITEWQHLARVGVLALALIPSLIGVSLLQCFCFLSLPILLLYSGKRGKGNFKYAFYLFYPLHLAALQVIAWILM